MVYSPTSLGVFPQSPANSKSKIRDDAMLCSKHSLTDLTVCLLQYIEVFYLFYRRYFWLPGLLAAATAAAAVSLIRIVWQQNVKMTALVNQRRLTPIVMAGWVRAASSHTLVSGDVIVLQKGKAMCDMVMLRGSCLVVESMLSGEVRVAVLCCAVLCCAVLCCIRMCLLLAMCAEPISIESGCLSSQCIAGHSNQVKHCTEPAVHSPWTMPFRRRKCASQPLCRMACPTARTSTRAALSMPAPMCNRLAPHAC